MVAHQPAKIPGVRISTAASVGLPFPSGRGGVRKFRRSTEYSDNSKKKGPTNLALENKHSSRRAHMLQSSRHAAQHRRAGVQ
jgi:hypothetical protein